MSDNYVKPINYEANNSNLNHNDLNALSSNNFRDEINKEIIILDNNFQKYRTNDIYKNNAELNKLYSSFVLLKEKYNICNNTNDLNMIKKGLDIISSRIINFDNQSILDEEPKEEKLEPTQETNEIKDSFNTVDKSIRKKEITNKISLCNIEIKEIKDNIQKFEDELNRKQKYLDTNKFYLDPIDVYGFEKAIQNNKNKIDNQKILLEKAQAKMKEYIGELSELNDINMAKTAIYDNLKEQIRLEKERELIDQKLNSLREEVPETLFTDDELENNSKITLK